MSRYSRKKVSRNEKGALICAVVLGGFLRSWLSTSYMADHLKNQPLLLSSVHELFVFLLCAAIQTYSPKPKEEYGTSRTKRSGSHEIVLAYAVIHALSIVVAVASTESDEITLVELGKAIAPIVVAVIAAKLSLLDLTETKGFLLAGIALLAMPYDLFNAGGNWLAIPRSVLYAVKLAFLCYIMTTKNPNHLHSSPVEVLFKSSLLSAVVVLPFAWFRGELSVPFSHDLHLWQLLADELISASFIVVTTFGVKHVGPVVISILSLLRVVSTPSPLFIDTVCYVALWILSASYAVVELQSLEKSSPKALPK
ncbi:hypothetical protein TRVA0_039S00914 [Trichomonascus vanleenenianus]|uniref:uncharacterized protein n=1 Tax=Trichomonascus vanleenenianus TaxID=2268995 RepID=UPI003ECA06F1